MTHADEAEFIQLWNQGASYKAIAQAQRCPLGTVASRAAALLAQGKITSRPRGGRRAKAQPDDSPAPARPPAPPPAITFMAVPKVRELIHTVKDLVARAAALEEGTRDGTRTPPAPARVDIEQWTVQLSTALIERIKAEAVAAQKPPSPILEELAWKAPNEQSPSMP